jgi:hypothetical protein
MRCRSATETPLSPTPLGGRYRSGAKFALVESANTSPHRGVHGRIAGGPAQREGRAGRVERSAARPERSRARGQGRKDRCPPIRIAYAKRGLVRIGRKDGKSALLLLELRTKGPGRRTKDTPPGGRGSPSGPWQPARNANERKSPIWGMRRPPVVCYRSRTRDPAEGNEADG